MGKDFIFPTFLKKFWSERIFVTSPVYERLKIVWTCAFQRVKAAHKPMLLIPYFRTPSRLSLSLSSCTVNIIIKASRQSYTVYCSFISFSMLNFHAFICIYVGIILQSLPLTHHPNIFLYFVIFVPIILKSFIVLFLPRFLLTMENFIKWMRKNKFCWPKKCF